MLLNELISLLRRTLFPSEKKKILLLSVALFLCALLELAGISCIIPVIALFVNPEVFLQNDMLSRAASLFGNIADPRQLMIRICLAGGAFYALKCVILSLVNALQIRLVFSIASRAAEQMTALYVRTSYAFHLQRRSSESLELVRQTRIAFVETINGCMMLISESLVIAVLFFSMLFISPGTAGTILGVLVLLSAGALFLFRKALNAGSRKILSLGSAVNNHLMQSVRSIREIKLSGRTDGYLESGKQLFRDTCRTEGTLFILSQQPRFLIEGGAACIGLLTIAVMVFAGIAPASVALRISFIGLGLARMMPSFSRINYYLVRIRANRTVFAGICRDLNNLRPELVTKEPETAITLDRMIRFENVDFSYDGRKIFDHLDLEIPARSSLALVGPTGAGKSTLLDLAAGLLVPDSGRITSDGTDIQRNLESWRRKIGYVPQTIVIDDATVLENVAFGVPVEKIDRTRVMRCLEIAQADGFVRELEHGADTLLGEQGIRLSGGQRQRIGIARALYPEPEILLLDEATSALDNATEAEFVAALEQLKTHYTLLIAAHRLSTVAHCDRRFEIGRQVPQEK